MKMGKYQERGAYEEPYEEISSLGVTGRVKKEVRKVLVNYLRKVLDDMEREVLYGREE